MLLFKSDWWTDWWLIIISLTLFMWLMDELIGINDQLFWKCDNLNWGSEWFDYLLIILTRFMDGIDQIDYIDLWTSKTWLVIGGCIGTLIDLLSFVCQI